MSFAKAAAANLPLELAEDNDRLLTVFQVAAMSGASERHIREQLALDKLRSCLLGKHRRIRMADYRAWVASLQSAAVSAEGTVAND